MSAPVSVLKVMHDAAWPLAESGEFLLPRALLDAREAVAELISAAREALQSLEYISRNHSEQVTGGFKREDDIGRLRAALAKVQP